MLYGIPFKNLQQFCCFMVQNLKAYLTVLDKQRDIFPFYYRNCSFNNKLFLTVNRCYQVLLIVSNITFFSPLAPFPVDQSLTTHVHLVLKCDLHPGKLIVHIISDLIFPLYLHLVFFNAFLLSTMRSDLCPTSKAA